MRMRNVHVVSQYVCVFLIVTSASSSVFVNIVLCHVKYVFVSKNNAF